MPEQIQRLSDVCLLEPPHPDAQLTDQVPQKDMPLLLAPPPEPAPSPRIHESPDYRPHPKRQKEIDPRIRLGAIPPRHKRRTLVLAFDGTGDQFDLDNSNIVQLVSILKKNDKTQQMVYYQTGIGTYTLPQIGTPLVSKISKILDSAVAWNLNNHVMEGYEFLMQNYTAGDKICIFGFSRGGYIARSLAGMIHKVGLLPSDNWQQVPFAYKMYTRTDQEGWEQSNAFKCAFSNSVTIDFLGVWDTVDSVGYISRRLPFVASNTIVKTFRHAISLDERRAKFKANFWNRPTEDETHLGLPNPNGLSCESSVDVDHESQTQEASPSPRSPPKSPRRSLLKVSPRKLFRDLPEDRDLDENERRWEEPNERQTDVQEVWFAGCHSDVGGGAVNNKTTNSLARISLRWMIRECFRVNSGIMFETQGLREIGLDPTTLYPFVTPRPPALLPDPGIKVGKTSPRSLLRRTVKSVKKRGKPEPQVKPTCTLEEDEIPNIATEEEEELKDALSPIHDQLKLTRAWWMLESIPLPFKYQRDDDRWQFTFAINHARPRTIPRQDQGVLIHRSVKIRMEAQENSKEKYTPKAKWDVAPTWVD